MNFYFINPEHINNSSWEAIIEILDIKDIIDINLPENDNSFNCFNEVFNSVSHKYYLNDYRPEYLELLQPIERAKCLKKGIQSIFQPFVDKVIESYGLDPEYKEKDKNNILVLCNDTSRCNAVVYYSVSYFLNRLHFMTKSRTSPRKYVDFHIIDFINLETKAYSSKMGFFCSFDNRQDQSYKYRSFKFSVFFSSLKEKYNIDQNSFLKREKINSSLIYYSSNVRFVINDKDLDYFLIDKTKLDSNSEKYTIKEAISLFQSKNGDVIKDKIKSKTSNEDQIKENMKVLIEEDLDQLPWMFEPIELRLFNSLSLRLIDIIFDRIKREHSPYSYYDVSLKNIYGAIVITVLMDGKMINMYHFRSDLKGCIATVHIWSSNLQDTFDKIREDGYIFSPRLKVDAISYRTVNVPQPVIGTLITMITSA